LASCPSLRDSRRCRRRHTVCVKRPRTHRLARQDGQEFETIFSRLVVVLDHLAPHRGAFGFGLEWARQFHLPICGVLTPDGAPAGALDCERRCTDTGLPWKLATWSELCYANSPHALMRPGDLIVFGQALPPAKKHQLFLQALRGNTVARSDRAARTRQNATRRLLSDRGLSADLDLIVTRDPRSAALSVARWRLCSLVVIPKNSAAPWWRWLRGGANFWCAKTMEPVSFLSFPGTGILSLPSIRARPPYPDFSHQTPVTRTRTMRRYDRESRKMNR
jgi:hypothetical protein